jgi:serine phosphatase RsbU (regulator of sigma subunit)
MSTLPTILGEIELWDSIVDISTPVRFIESQLLENPGLPGFVVVEDWKIIGILSRTKFVAALSRPFAREIFIKDPVKILFDFDIVDINPIILNVDTSIPEAVQKALDRSFLMSYEPIIVMDNLKPKVLEVDLLMRCQSNILKDAIFNREKLIEEEQRSANQLRSTLQELEQVRDTLLRSEELLEAQVIKRTLELEKVNQDLIQQQKSIQEDLQVARTLQQSILPEIFPQSPGYKGYAFMRAARMIGGDFYDAYKISEHEYGFVVGDVSGKGVPAALFMVLVKTILQEQSGNHHSPAECITHLNTQLLNRNPLSLFVTLIYGILDIRTGVFTFCNGGHSMPYILRENKSIETIANKPSPLVGLLDNPKYTNISVQLEKNDRILLITDGVTECFNDQNEAYGELRLLNLLKSTHKKTAIEDLIKKIVVELDLFSNGVPASDDITALILHYENETSGLHHTELSNLGNLKTLH